MPDDPVLLITGASSGIGAATARAAVSKYRLVLAARKLEALEELVDELGGDGRALAVKCDVTEWDQMEAMAAAALERFGRIVWSLPMPGSAPLGDFSRSHRSTGARWC